MIFGVDTCRIEILKNSNYLFINPLLYTLNCEYNIPDMLLQKAINGDIIKILKGYYHRFTIDIYKISANDQEFIEEMRENLTNFFYPHKDNLEFKFEINTISQPFYYNNINGFNCCKIVFESKAYTSLITQSEEEEEGQ